MCWVVKGLDDSPSLLPELGYVYTHKHAHIEKPTHKTLGKERKWTSVLATAFFLILAPGLYCAVKQAITWQQLGGLEPNTWSSPIRALQWQLTVQSHSQVALLQ